MRGLKFLICAIVAGCFAGPASAQGGLLPRASIISFGLWDDQRVFQLEAFHGAAVVARDLGAGRRVTVRANTPGHPAASPRALGQALLAASRKMNAERDLMVLILTSHGAPRGIGVKMGKNTFLLPPAVLKDALVKTGIRHKVIIVSACYSGLFADELADADTLVITAADAGHPSFGCTNTARWTWFGQAFFGEALMQTRSLPQAFGIASASIARRELAEKFDPSNPQLRGGEHVLPLLDALTR